MHASGGVVVRTEDGGERVLLVHRPKYDDWSLPKGKREPGETDEQCAVREVEEETGLRCALGRELLATTYVDAQGRPKVVRYWSMSVVHEGEWHPSREIDELRWVGLEDARTVLSYERDVDVLRSYSG